ncbi:hypothetical protein H4219_002545 [Mycoemilia scoparia]|uniref:Uncharacterized protein n=1 Tax=Mycoemilia scoparia TaxID=417184 RepID=A0A9W7ZY09_9FUNG|nr:hypothetical protein H4219_002545 [Mycoemilia scoparia]
MNDTNINNSQDKRGTFGDVIQNDLQITQNELAFNGAENAAIGQAISGGIVRQVSAGDKTSLSAFGHVDNGDGNVDDKDGIGGEAKEKGEEDTKDVEDNKGKPPIAVTNSTVAAEVVEGSSDSLVKQAQKGIYRRQQVLFKVPNKDREDADSDFTSAELLARSIPLNNESSKDHALAKLSGYIQATENVGRMDPETLAEYKASFDNQDALNMISRSGRYTRWDRNKHIYPKYSKKFGDSTTGSIQNDNTDPDASGSNQETN